MNYELHHGDNREVLRTMPDNFIDSIVCDPPYELGFMGKRWDSTGIAYDVTLWAECLRVLKPGGHLIAFGGTRTYHRMTVAIEDAGFEIRDCIQWIYGSGFPKSLDVSKAIDKQNKDNQQKRANSQLERRLRFTAWVRSTGLTSSQIDKATGTNMGGHYTTQASQPAIMTRQHLDAVRHLIGDVPDWVEAEVDIRTLGIEESEAWKAREVVKEKHEDIFGEYEVVKNYHGDMGGFDGIRLGRSGENITAPHLPEAQQWHGFGTALKPANEPAVLARKPLSGTVADNVLTWGCGALNIDGCRVGTTKNVPHSGSKIQNGFGLTRKNIEGIGSGFDANIGRWPANVILDEEAAQMLDEQSGYSVSKASNRGVVEIFHDNGAWRGESTHRGHTDSGGASRFFYVAKASRAEREAGLEGMPLVRESDKIRDDGVGGDNPRNRTNNPRINHHPTVKPIALMRYLVRMVTPRDGVVLDPFMGSGTTGCAAMLEGINFIGIDITPEYKDIAERRIQYWASQNPMGL